MAALIIPSRRIVQPLGPVEIDRNHSLSDGLVLFAYAAAGSDRFANIQALQSSAPIGSDPDGNLAWNPGSTAGCRVGFGTTQPISSTGSRFSIAVKANPQASATQLGTLFSQYDAAGGQPFIGFGYNATAANFAGQAVGGSGRLCLCLRDNGLTVRGGETDASTVTGLISMYGVSAVADNSTELRFFVDGIKYATNDSVTAPSTTFVSSGQLTALGNMGAYVGSGIWEANCAFLVAAVWNNRYLLDAEHIAFWENPWQVLRPVERRLWIVPAAAPSAGLTAIGMAGGAGGGIGAEAFGSSA